MSSLPGNSSGVPVLGGLSAKGKLWGAPMASELDFTQVGSRMGIGRTGGLKLPAHRRALYSTGGVLSTPM